MPPEPGWPEAMAIIEKRCARGQSTGERAGIMIIAQISDTHIALDPPEADQRISDLALTVADINELDPLPDAIVHTGDIVHNGQQDEYAQAGAILAKARPPVYVLAGNKDNMWIGAQFRPISARWSTPKPLN